MKRPILTCERCRYAAECWPDATELPKHLPACRRYQERKEGTT